MNYEEFSPEAKAGIEQFRKSVTKNKLAGIANIPSDIVIRWINNTQMVCIACILNGTEANEGLLAQKFAESKNYWLD